MSISLCPEICGIKKCDTVIRGTFFNVMKDFCPMPKKRDIRPVAQEITDELLNKYHKELGARIKTLRSKQGHRQDHFAYEIGMGRNTLIAIEAGTPHTTESLLRIIYGLGINLDEFFAEGFTPLPEQKQERPKSK